MDGRAEVLETEQRQRTLLLFHTVAIESSTQYVTLSVRREEEEEI